MTTLTDLVNQIDRGLLIHYTRPLYDTPSASYTDSQTNIVLTSTDNLGPGALLDANFELMHVRSWNEATRTATVIRGFLGTTTAAGDGTDLVRINPRFNSVAMYDAMVDELRSWGEELFVVEEEAVAIGATSATVGLNPVRRPYRILYARLQGTDVDDPRRHLNVRLLLDEPTSLYASGYSMMLPYTLGVGDTVDVLYAMPVDLTGLTDSTSLEITHGLTPGMLEILKWGAMYRLVAGKEAARLDTQTAIRPDLEQSVPAMANLQAGVQYQRMRDAAYDREYRRLLGQFPWRF